MAASRETQAPPDAAPVLDYEAIVIGAGHVGHVSAAPIT